MVGITAQDILEDVCSALGVSPEDVRGPKRRPRLVVARMLVASLTERLSVESTTEVAEAIGRTHVSIVEARAELRRDPQAIGRRYDACVARFFGGRVSLENAAGDAVAATRAIKEASGGEGMEAEQGR